MHNRELKLILATEKILSVGMKAGCKRRSQLSAILIIGNCPGCQIFHVARLLTVKHQSASIRIGILSARGYLYRDGRKFYLTDAGREAFNVVKEYTAAIVRNYQFELIHAFALGAKSQ